VGAHIRLWEGEKQVRVHAGKELLTSSIPMLICPLLAPQSTSCIGIQVLSSSWPLRAKMPLSHQPPQADSLLEPLQVPSAGVF
jgi:hypothetical protein